jgi:hypothetical protein
MWAVACGSLGFLHRFGRSRNVVSACMTGLFAGNLGAGFSWIPCRDNFRKKHLQYVRIMELRREAGEDFERKSHTTFRLDDDEQPRT